MSQPEKIRSAQKSFEVIEELRRKDGQRVSDIADNLDMSVSSAYKYLHTLNDLGYVRKEQKSYYLGLRFLDLGTIARRQNEIYERAEEKVIEFSKQIGEIASLVVKDDDQCVYVVSTNPLGNDSPVRVGTRVDPASHAAGIAVLIDTSGSRLDHSDYTVEEMYDRQVVIGPSPKGEEYISVALRIHGTEGAVSLTAPESNITGRQLTEEIPGSLIRSIKRIEKSISREGESLFGSVAEGDQER